MSDSFLRPWMWCVENMAEIETSKNGGSSGNTQELLGSDEEEDRYVASARKSTLKGDDRVWEYYIADAHKKNIVIL